MENKRDRPKLYLKRDELLVALEEGLGIELKCLRDNDTLRERRYVTNKDLKKIKDALVEQNNLSYSDLKEIKHSSRKKGIPHV